jgi:phosphopantothenate synthetase
VGDDHDKSLATLGDRRQSMTSRSIWKALATLVPVMVGLRHEAIVVIPIEVSRSTADR